MRSMKRRLAIALVPLFLLISCGGSGETTEVTCKEQFWDGTVALCLPAGWTIVDRETLADRGVPDEVLAAFQTAQAQAGQFPTVTVTKETLTEALDSPTYSDASMKSVSTLPGYTHVDTKNVAVDAENVDLHIFTAQPLNDEPARRFYQVSAIAGGNGYTVTGLAPVTIASQLDKEIQLILSSFSLKAPTAAESSED
jgi:hypothetical protein